MKLKQRDKYILLLVLGILVAVATYFFVFKKFNEMNETLQVENRALKEEVEYLQKLMNDREFYIAETDRMGLEMEEMKAQFPSELYPEDEIYYAYNSETKYDVATKSMALPEAVEISVAQPVSNAAEPEVVDDGSGAETVEGEAVAESVEDTAPARPSITLFKSAVTFDFQITYDATKDWIKEILADKENKKAIESVSLSYDKTTGNIKGKMVVNMFSLTGTERTYEAPSIPGIGVGTDDLFKSSDRLNASTENNAFDANADSTEGEADSTEKDEEEE